MSDQTSREQLITELDATVADSLEFFITHDPDSEARVGDWGVWETLCHMIYWHRATSEGIESVATGGSPRQIATETDEANAQIIESRSGKTVEELAAEVRELQGRMVSAVRSIPDPTSTVFIRLNGTESTTNDRLQAMTGHWREHVKELKEAD